MSKFIQTESRIEFTRVLGLGDRGMGNYCLFDMDLLFGMMKSPGNVYWVCLYNTVNVLKVIKLYT